MFRRRVRSGVPTGGQFAAHDRDEAETSLTHPRWRDGERAAATRSMLRLAHQVADTIPGAVTVRTTFSVQDSRLTVTDVLDADGRSLGPISAELARRELPGDGTIDHGVTGFRWRVERSGNVRRRPKILGADIDIHAAIAVGS